MWGARKAWLSLTPEPERELPAAIATLRAGGPPTPEDVERERRRAERLVLRGSRRGWIRWLRETRQLVAENADAAGSEDARGVALDVIENHHALVLGLPGRPFGDIEAERKELTELSKSRGRGGRGGRGGR
jgi:hypothetical protein